MIEAITYRLLLRPDPIKKKTKSGLIIAADEKLERNATQTGTILGIGPDVYAAHRTSLKFGGLEEGDRVFYAKYSGAWVIDPDTNEELLMVNDEDIIGKLKGTPADEYFDPLVATQSS